MFHYPQTDYKKAHFALNGHADLTYHIACMLTDDGCVQNLIPTFSYMDFNIAGTCSIDNTSVHITKFTFKGGKGDIAFLEIFLVKSDMSDFRSRCRLPRATSRLDTLSRPKNKAFFITKRAIKSAIWVN